MTEYENGIAFITAKQRIESRWITSPYPFYYHYTNGLDQNTKLLKKLVLSSGDYSYKIESVKIPEETKFVRIDGMGKKMDGEGFKRFTAMIIKSDTKVLTVESWLAPKIFCYVFSIPSGARTLDFQIGLDPDRIFSEEEVLKNWIRT